MRLRTAYVSVTSVVNVVVDTWLYLVVALLSRLSKTPSPLTNSDLFRADIPAQEQEDVVDRMPTRPRKRQRRLTPDEVDELVAAREAGSTMVQLAEQFGIKRQTVSAILHRQGDPRPHQPKLSPADVHEAVQRYNSGEPSPSIATDFNVHPESLRRALRRSGVVMRLRGASAN